MSSTAEPYLTMSPGHPRMPEDVGPTGQQWLIEALLADQDDLTAVERFAQSHEDAEAPIQGRFYATLMPSQPPGPGQQLAFEVDLDRCSGCKACVAACHSLNGLDHEEAWRDVGLLVGGTSRLPVLQHVTTACHHCLDPACLIACPVDAYEKDPITGIVRHLDDQCIGCRYCTLACPYDVPKYHPGKGIVRKCDMCADRLKEGEAPACVQACPHEAIRIRVVDRAEVLARAESGAFLPTAPDPRLTRPTTRYLSSRPAVGPIRSADGHRGVPEHVHSSLVVMLVLTQLSAGVFAIDFLARAAGVAGGRATAIFLAIGLGMGHLGLVASTCHLGRPQYAYRAMIGLRHSWLSREVAAFGAFIMFATAHASLAVAATDWYGRRAGLGLALSAGAAIAGAAGVGCSMMVYHVTRRPFWDARRSAAKFVATACLLGLATWLVASTWADPGDRTAGMAACLGAMAVFCLKMGVEARFLAHLNEAEHGSLYRSARLLTGPLDGVWRLRRALGAIGGIVLPALWLGAPEAGAAIATAALGALIAGEMAERALFFAAVVRPRMPGGVAS